MGLSKRVRRNGQVVKEICEGLKAAMVGKGATVPAMSTCLNSVGFGSISFGRPFMIRIAISIRFKDCRTMRDILDLGLKALE